MCIRDSYRNGTTAKDVLGDYPHLYEKLKKDEFGYMKGTLQFIVMLAL